MIVKSQALHIKNYHLELIIKSFIMIDDYIQGLLSVLQMYDIMLLPHIVIFVEKSISGHLLLEHNIFVSKLGMI